MSTFDNKKVAKEETRKKNSMRLEKLAGHFFDLSKLSFAGLIIGLVLPLFSDVNNLTIWLAVLFGSTITIVSALLANKILK